MFDFLSTPVSTATDAGFNSPLHCENYESAYRCCTKDINDVFYSIGLSAHDTWPDWNSFPCRISHPSLPGVSVIHVVPNIHDRYFDIEKMLADGCTLTLRIADKAYFTVTKEDGKEYVLNAIRLSDMEGVLEKLGTEREVMEPATHQRALANPFLMYRFDEVVESYTEGHTLFVKSGGYKGLGHKVALTLTEKFATLLEEVLVCDDWYAELTENTEPLGWTLRYSYNHIIGGCCICVIDPSSIPDEFLAQFASETAAKTPAPIASRASTQGAENAMSVQDELQMLSVVSDSRIELPTDKVLMHYSAIRRMLLEANGKYVRGGFNFTTRKAGDVLNALVEGKKVRSEHKDYAFFATPADEADRLVSLLNLCDGMRLLEPHAGHGHVADAVRRVVGIEPIVNELWEQNVAVLTRKGYKPYSRDFLEMTADDVGGLVDCVVGNPPWGNLIDIDHFLHALTFLSRGGQIAMIVSASAFTSNTQKAIAFRELLVKQGAVVTTIPSGTFSGTNVEGRQVFIGDYQQ